MTYLPEELGRFLMVLARSLSPVQTEYYFDWVEQYAGEDTPPFMLEKPTTPKGFMLSQDLATALELVQSFFDTENSLEVDSFDEAGIITPGQLYLDYTGNTIVFDSDTTTVALRGASVKIMSMVGSTGLYPGPGLPASPSAGDTFKIVGTLVQPQIDQLRSSASALAPYTIGMWALEELMRVLDFSPSTGRVTFIDGWDGAGALYHGYLEVDDTPQEGDTITIGDVTYTLNEDLVDEPYHIHIKGSTSDMRTAIVRAIMAGDGEGVDYGTGTEAHPMVWARVTGNGVTVLSKWMTEDYELDTLATSGQLVWDEDKLEDGEMSTLIEVDGQRFYFVSTAQRDALVSMGVHQTEIEGQLSIAIGTTGSYSNAMNAFANAFSGFTSNYDYLGSLVEVEYLTWTDNGLATVFRTRREAGDGEDLPLSATGDFVEVRPFTGGAVGTLLQGSQLTALAAAGTSGNTVVLNIPGELRVNEFANFYLSPTLVSARYRILSNTADGVFTIEQPLSEGEGPGTNFRVVAATSDSNVSTFGGLRYVVGNGAGDNERLARMLVRAYEITID